MATPHGEDRWKDMDITKEEVDRIGKALKDEKFRKMFVEYAEEISDPKNRELYEKEIAQMEAERGMDVQFIHPKPGHVLKVMSKSPGTPNQSKVFINICQNDLIDPPSNEKKIQSNGKAGLQWSIPHSFSPAREDLDKKGEKCAVYDVVFHPDTYKMSSNQGFLKLIHDTAIDGLERQFGLEIDRNSLTRLQKLKFKGQAQPTVMRKKKANQNVDEKKENDPIGQFPYPYEKGVSSEELAKRQAQQVAEQKRRKEARVDAKKEKEETSNGVITPEYTITNQYDMDLSNYGHSLSGTPLPVDHAPSALVISIHLPQLKSAAPCQLDVMERSLTLKSEEPIVYKLSLTLPHHVDDSNGSAKFDKTKKRLVVTLPVDKKKVIEEVKVPETAQTDAEVIESRLIEELESGGDGGMNECGQDVEEVKEEVNISLDEKILYKLPKFTFDQDEESVTLVLEVAWINNDSFVTVYDEGKVEVVFSTLGRTGFPSHYHLRCLFPSAVSSISRSLGEQNAVLTIVKVDKGFWDSFHSSGSCDTVELHKFVSKSDLEQEIAELETRETDLNLAIDVKEVEKDQEELLSPTVVHQDGQTSNIHGILKRTTSESSGDDLQSCGDMSARPPLEGVPCDESSTSPTDLPSPRERKKSVSFSDRVEETTFKSKDSVCQMHKTLLNRRKKQRQRQNRREEHNNRRRRNSSTETNSGGEESSKKKGRRRRHSSSTSDDGNSPRAPAISPNPSDETTEKCTCPQDGEVTQEMVQDKNTPKVDESEELNSDDDEESSPRANGVTNWSESSEFVEKTKCAFDFHNSVIFDLDE